MSVPSGSVVGRCRGAAREDVGRRGDGAEEPAWAEVMEGGRAVSEQGRAEGTGRGGSMESVWDFWVGANTTNVCRCGGMVDGGFIFNSPDEVVRKLEKALFRCPYWLTLSDSVEEWMM